MLVFVIIILAIFLLTAISALIIELRYSKKDLRAMGVELGRKK